MAITKTRHGDSLLVAPHSWDPANGQSWKRSGPAPSLSSPMASFNITRTTACDKATTRTQVALCKINAKGMYASHIPHIAQVMFPCLSFFRYHAAPSCGFTGSVPTHPFAQWLIEQAGCINFKIQEVTNTLSTSRLPKCAVEGKYDVAKYSVSPGETFKWFPTD